MKTRSNLMTKLLENKNKNLKKNKKYMKIIQLKKILQFMIFLTKKLPKLMIN